MCAILSFSAAIADEEVEEEEEDEEEEVVEKLPIPSLLTLTFVLSHVSTLLLGLLLGPFSLDKAPEQPQLESSFDSTSASAVPALARLRVKAVRWRPSSATNARNLMTMF